MAVPARKSIAVANDSLTERGLAIADVVGRVAGELGHTPAQVALAWTLRNPAVTAPIVGARTTRQLADNLGALNVTFDDHHLKRLHQASAVELGFPHDFLARPLARSTVFGDLRIRADTPA